MKESGFRSLVILGQECQFTQEALEGLSRGISASGYEPYRVQSDTKPSDETERTSWKSMQDSRFVIFDLSDTDRGRVFHQAGWAEGLEVPTVYTCHKSRQDHVHAGIQHHRLLVWDSAANLAQKLQAYLEARFGRGPLVPPEGAPHPIYDLNAGERLYSDERILWQRQHVWCVASLLWNFPPLTLILVFGILSLFVIKPSDADLAVKLKALLALGLLTVVVFALFSSLMGKFLFNPVQLTMTSRRLCYSGPLGARWSKELKSLYRTQVGGLSTNSTLVGRRI